MDGQPRRQILPCHWLIPSEVPFPVALEHAGVFHAADCRRHISPEGIHTLAMFREPMHNVGMIADEAELMGFDVTDDIFGGESEFLHNMAQSSTAS